MRIAWTGLGWLALPIVAVTLVVGGLLAIPLGSATTLGSGAVLGTTAFAFALSAFPTYLLGRALNSSVGADGRRVWHNRHRMGTASLVGKTGPLLPLQNMWGGQLGVAYLVLCAFVGGALLNSKTLVLILMVLPVVAGIVVVITVRRRRTARAAQAIAAPLDIEQVRARSRQATQAIKAGQTLRFGGVTVSHAGLGWDGRTVPFTEIERIHYDRDNLYLQLPAGRYAYPLSRIDDHPVAVGVMIGLHRAATGRTSTR
jgi:hypothetical protein